MNINLTISSAPSITDSIAVRIFKASNPLVVVDAQIFAPPHNTPQNVTFADVDPVTFIVNIYETTSLMVTGTLRQSFIYQPSYESIEIRPTEFLKMVGGDTSYTNVDWKTWDIDIIYRVAFGPMFEPDQLTWITDVDGDVIGFNLAAGDEFTPDEQFTVQFYPKVQVLSPTVQSAKTITDEEIITVDTVLTDADAGKLLRLQGAGSAFTVSLPAISTTDTFLQYFFASDGGNHVNVTIDVDGGGNINYFGNRTELHLAQGERAMIIYTGTDYVVLNNIDGVLRVGDILFQNDKDATVQGAIFADGSLLDRTVYRRLWEYVQQLDASLLIADATWTGSSEQHGKFSDGDGSTTFRIPRLYSAGYLRGVEGTGITRLAGSYQADDVKAHTHTFTRTRTDTIGTNYEANRMRSGGDRGLWTGDTVNTGSTGGETTPKNTGIYLLMRI